MNPNKPAPVTAMMYLRPSEVLKMPLMKSIDTRRYRTNLGLLQTN